MAADKLVDSTQLDADLTSIANAIRAKSGGSGSLAFPNGFVSAIEDIETGGGGWTTDGIAQNLEPNGPIVLGDSVTEVAGQAFRLKPITSVIGPNVTTIRSQAFYECTSLVSVYFPKATTVVTEVLRGSYVSEITDAQFPVVSSIGQAGFGTMPKLVKAFLSTPTSLANYCFDACPLLLTGVFKNVGKLNTGAFRGCSTLQAVDLGGNGSASIAANSFQNCLAFNVLVLRNTTITTLANVSAFSNSPFASGKAGGTLYVPSALVSSYESASNWSTILGYGSGAQNQILAIEGSIYETQYADGTPIT